MFSFFLENRLIAQKQSGLKPDDPSINRLLSITHQIHKLFDDRFEARSVFLDVTKAFLEVWHQGMIFKLRQNDIPGDRFNVLP